MTIDRNKLAIISAAAWGTILLPLASELGGSHFEMNIFWYAILAYPVWFTFGWRWVTDNTAIPAKIWVILLFAGIPSAMYLDDYYRYDDVFYIPVLCSLSFAYFLWVFQGQRLSWDSIKNLNYQPPFWLLVVAVLLITFLSHVLAAIVPPVIGAALSLCFVVSWLMYKLYKKDYLSRKWFLLLVGISWVSILLLILMMV